MAGGMATALRVKRVGGEVRSVRGEECARRGGGDGVGGLRLRKMGRGGGWRSWGLRVRKF